MVKQYMCQTSQVQVVNVFKCSFIFNTAAVSFWVHILQVTIDHIELKMPHEVKSLLKG